MKIPWLLSKLHTTPSSQKQYCSLCSIHRLLIIFLTYLVSDKNHLKKKFPRGARLGYYVDSFKERFYGYESGMLTERIWGMPESRWLTNPAILPTGAGTSKILANFIVLGWPRDMDFTASEIHLFSLDESGLLWDYLVGLGTASSISLLEA